jgi:hypothetical protein
MNVRHFAPQGNPVMHWMSRFELQAVHECTEAEGMWAPDKHKRWREDNDDLLVDPYVVKSFLIASST